MSRCLPRAMVKRRENGFFSFFSRLLRIRFQGKEVWGWNRRQSVWLPFSRMKNTITRWYICTVPLSIYNSQITSFTYNHYVHRSLRYDSYVWTRSQLTYTICKHERWIMLISCVCKNTHNLTPTCEAVSVCLACADTSGLEELTDFKTLELNSCCTISVWWPGRLH